MWANHDVLTLDYNTAQSLTWSGFFNLYGKYLGEWSKTELADPKLEPKELFIIYSVVGVGDKLALAAKMWAFRIFSPSREQRELGALIRSDGPYEYAERASKLEKADASK